MSSFFFLNSSSANRFCSIYSSLSSSVILASFFLPDFFFLGGIFGKKLKKFRSVNAKTRWSWSVVAVDNITAGFTYCWLNSLHPGPSRSLAQVYSSWNLDFRTFENSFFKTDISRFISIDGWKNEEKENWCRRIWTPRWDSRAEQGERGLSLFSFAQPK